MSSSQPSRLALMAAIPVRLLVALLEALPPSLQPLSLFSFAGAAAVAVKNLVKTLTLIGLSRILVSPISPVPWPLHLNISLPRALSRDPPHPHSVTVACDNTLTARGFLAVADWKEQEQPLGHRGRSTHLRRATVPLLPLDNRVRRAAPLMAALG